MHSKKSIHAPPFFIFGNQSGLCLDQFAFKAIIFKNKQGFFYFPFEERFS
jgi:hypothetical protein